MEYYSAIETFSMWFCVLFYGGISICFIAAWVSLYFEWKAVGKECFLKDSEPSDDYLIERDKVLTAINERIGEYSSCDFICAAELKELASLKDSSEVASLFRYAHFAGFHLTFEQNEQEWNSDPEYLDPNVFKTDMKEATALREEREWNRYKRHYDPPKSPRDKVLARNIF
jgi:hypothetical protein